MMESFELSRRLWERRQRERKRLLWTAGLGVLSVAACLAAGALLPQSAALAVSFGLTFVVAALCRR
jgi:hypothetical protein